MLVSLSWNVATSLSVTRAGKGYTYTLLWDTLYRCFEVLFSHHSKKVLKSHSEIYKVYGFLVQGET